MSKKKSRKKSRKKSGKKSGKKSAKKAKPTRAKKKARKPTKAKKAKKAKRKPGAKKVKSRRPPSPRLRTAPSVASAKDGRRPKRKAALKPVREPLVPPGVGGLLLVLSGPSGAGKSTLARMLARADGRIWRSVSMTTRAPRDDERDGIDYIFVPRAEFERARRGGELLESALVHGEVYGTPRAPVVERLVQGRDVLLEIDVRGAMQVKKRAPDAVLVFVRPPSRAVLESRLRERGSESEESIRLRLAAADEEVRHAGEYDYLVTNDELGRAVSEITSVITAERSRVRRRRDLSW